MKKFINWLSIIIFYIYITVLYFPFFATYPIIYYMTLLNRLGLKDHFTNSTYLITKFIIAFLLSGGYIFLLVWLWKKKRLIFWILFIVHIYCTYKYYGIIKSPHEPVYIQISNK